MSSYLGARSHASTVRVSHTSRIAAGNASRLAAAGLAVFLTIGFAGTAHADQPTDVAAKVADGPVGNAAAQLRGQLHGQTSGESHGRSDSASNGRSGEVPVGAVGGVGQPGDVPAGAAAPGAGHDAVVVCHNGHEIVIDDDGAENGHDQHGDLVADASAAAGETVVGSDEECVKDHPIKIDDELDEVLEDDETKTDDADSDDADSGSNAGGNDKAGDAKGGKARNGKGKNGKANTGKAKGNKGKNGKPKGNKGNKGNKEQDNGDGAGSTPDNGSGDGADTDTGAGTGGNSGTDTGAGTGGNSGTDTGAGTGTGADAGTGTGTGSKGSTPGTKPVMPPKAGTSKPVVEVLGEEATRPKPVVPGKDRVNTKNRAPIVILPELRADRPRHEILPAAAAARPGTAHPGAMVLPQTGLGDDLGMLAGIGGTMLLTGGMSLTAGRRRSTTQI